MEDVNSMDFAKNETFTRLVIVGGGIAGINCAKTLLQNCFESSSNFEIILISASAHVKTVTNWHKIGQFSEHFEVAETRQIFENDSRFKLIYDEVINWDSKQKLLYLKLGQSIKYSKLCIATGASPICPWSLKNVKVVRDTDTVAAFQDKLANSNHIVIVGNGGIATELVFELQNIQISWIIRDSTVSSSFFPSDVESFIIPKLLEGRKNGSPGKTAAPLKRLKFTTSFKNCSNQSTLGVSLGPDWCTVADLTGANSGHSLNLLKNCQVSKITENLSEKDSLSINVFDSQTKKTLLLNCDLVIWATGVAPNSSPWSSDPNLKLSSLDSGILVNDIFETSIPDVYACGDVCSIHNPPETILWKQMKLWTQARQTSELCARSMLTGAESRIFNIYLELFTHCTSFFGLKIVFIGDYKPEKQKKGHWTIVERIIGESEYVRCVLVNHRMVGALLIGETELEETMENMIMNKTNLEGIEETFLDPTIEIDDFFD